MRGRLIDGNDAPDLERLRRIFSRILVIRIAQNLKLWLDDLQPAAFVVRRNWVDGHVILARRLENPRFRRIETFSPRNHLHAFRFTSANEIDDEVAAWFAEAYRVGEQRHLGFGTVEAKSE